MYNMAEEMFKKVVAQESKWNDVKEILPPFNKIVELNCNGNILKAGLFDYQRPEQIVRWLLDNPNKIEFSTATKWRFINE